MSARVLFFSVVVVWLSRSVVVAEPIKGQEWTQNEARIHLDWPVDFDAKKPSLLLIFALPNGNTIEMTAGGKLLPGMDFRYDIQHIAAQTRLLRKVEPERNIVLAYIEAQAKSIKLTWPAWRKEHGVESGKIIRGIVDDIAKTVIARSGTSPLSIALAAHSGGGSFLFGYINGDDRIPDQIERIAWIDANYAYDEEADHHGSKLLDWVNRGAAHNLVVIAYNDRAATFNGKPFVSETGGTFYRSHKMVDFFQKPAILERKDHEPFEEYVGLNNRVHFLLHTNPEKKILHTVLVERNGLLESMTWNTPAHQKWGGEFWGKRAYSEWVDDRVMSLLGGKAFADSVADRTPRDLDAALLAEVQKGNVPDFLRKTVTIHVGDDKHRIDYQVMPDYLAIGTDDDFVRMPMTPAAAQKIADAMNCRLPTRKMVDDVYAQAKVKIEPKPLTEKREAIGTFVQHNSLIEQQLAGKTRGELVAGHKKDIVITNKLKERASRVAIYGWHKLDGVPIQPLTTVHVDWYADYSHGVRLIASECLVDGKAMKIDDVLKDPELSRYLSDEGPIDVKYPTTRSPATKPAG